MGELNKKIRTYSLVRLTLLDHLFYFFFFLCLKFPIIKCFKTYVTAPSKGNARVYSESIVERHLTPNEGPIRVVFTEEVISELGFAGRERVSEAE